MICGMCSSTKSFPTSGCIDIICGSPRNGSTTVACDDEKLVEDDNSCRNILKSVSDYAICEDDAFDTIPSSSTQSSSSEGANNSVLPME